MAQRVQMENQLKIITLLFTVLYLLGCNNTPQSFDSPKVKYIGVTKHPEKGRVVSEFGKEATKNEYYDADFNKCTDLTYQKGVTINGKLSTDKGEIETFLSSVSSLSAKSIVFKAANENTGFTSAQKEALKEYDRFMATRWTCMENIGWTSGLEEVPIGD